MTTGKRTVALIGARGFTGRELVALLDGHPGFTLAAVSSRQLDGERVDAHFERAPAGLRFEALTPDVVGEREIDVWVLALPNGKCEPWVAAIEARAPKALVVDLSSDHRFDDGWTYGLPEVQRKRLLAAKRVANPGCYATGALLTLQPIVELLAGPATVFGVSGYSGAGTTPSPKNDPEQLRDNLMPYSLTGHTHETEIRWQLGHTVHFMPHVAPFFRGITLTVSVRLAAPLSAAELLARYERFYAYEPMVAVTADIPLVRDAAGRHGATIGGFAVEVTESRAVIVATLDNLLKGAATQALQNMNLACGLDELTGIRQHLAPRT